METCEKLKYAKRENYVEIKKIVIIFIIYFTVKLIYTSKKLIELEKKITCRIITCKIWLRKWKSKKKLKKLFKWMKNPNMNKNLNHQNLLLKNSYNRKKKNQKK